MGKPSIAPGGGNRTRLSATLFSGDRLYPVTVTSLTEGGFAAEGVALDHLEPEFLLEMTLPPIGDAVWSPKAVAVALPRSAQATPLASRVRVRACVEQLEAAEHATPLVRRLVARFDGMGDTCRATIRSWLARLGGAERPPARGLLSRPPVPEA